MGCDCVCIHLCPDRPQCWVCAWFDGVVYGYRLGVLGNTFATGLGAIVIDLTQPICWIIAVDYDVIMRKFYYKIAYRNESDMLAGMATFILPKQNQDWDRAAKQAVQRTKKWAKSSGYTYVSRKDKP